MKKTTVSCLVGLLALLLVSLSGCRSGEWYFSQGTEGILAAASQTSLTVREGNILFMDYQNRYNAWYGSEGSSFWEETVEGVPFSEWLKNNRIREEICALLLLNDMAADQKLVLTEEEKNACAAAADAYWSGLSDLEKEYVNSDVSAVRSLYEKYFTAQLIIESLSGDAYLEISENDKRIVILWLLCTDNAETAQKLQERIENGADFAALARENSLLNQVEYQVSRGDLAAPLEEVAFYLSSGELGEVTYSGRYYYLIYCVSDYDEEQSADNETEVYNRTRYDIWSETVLARASDTQIGIASGFWNRLSLQYTTKLTNTSLYDIYHSYLDTLIEERKRSMFS